MPDKEKYIRAKSEFTETTTSITTDGSDTSVRPRSRETIPKIFEKIHRVIYNLKKIAFTGSYADLAVAKNFGAYVGDISGSVSNNTWYDILTVNEEPSSYFILASINSEGDFAKFYIDITGSRASYTGAPGKVTILQDFKNENIRISHIKISGTNNGGYWTTPFKISVKFLRNTSDSASMNARMQIFKVFTKSNATSLNTTLHNFVTHSALEKVKEYEFSIPSSGVDMNTVISKIQTRNSDVTVSANMNTIQNGVNVGLTFPSGSVIVSVSYKNVHVDAHIESVSWSKATSSTNGTISVSYEAYNTLSNAKLCTLVIVYIEP